MEILLAILNSNNYHKRSNCERIEKSTTTEMTKYKKVENRIYTRQQIFSPTNPRLARTHIGYRITDNVFSNKLNKIPKH